MSPLGHKRTAKDHKQMEGGAGGKTSSHRKTNSADGQEPGSVLPICKTEIAVSLFDKYTCLKTTNRQRGETKERRGGVS